MKRAWLFIGLLGVGLGGLGCASKSAAYAEIQEKALSSYILIGDFEDHLERGEALTFLQQRMDAAVPGGMTLYVDAVAATRLKLGTAIERDPNDPFYVKPAEMPDGVPKLPQTGAYIGSVREKLKLFCDVTGLRWRVEGRGVFIEMPDEYDRSVTAGDEPCGL